MYNERLHWVFFGSTDLLTLDLAGRLHGDGFEHGGINSLGTQFSLLGPRGQHGGCSDKPGVRTNKADEEASSPLVVAAETIARG